MERKKERDRTIRDPLNLLPEGHRLDEKEFAHFGRPLGEALGRVIYSEKKPEE